MKALAQAWYAPPSPWLRTLLPLSWLFRRLAQRRRQQYRGGQRPVYRAPVPVIIVGNISAGGTGKTPLVAWLAARCREQGLRPGIISRGYGSRAPAYPYDVRPDSPSTEAGDEALLLARNSACPVVIAPDRAAAARHLLASHPCDLLISDDGLQHYALARDIEIAVVDGQRGLGNGWQLPAGPLREPKERLLEVDFIIGNGGIPKEVETLLQAGSNNPQGLAQAAKDEPQSSAQNSPEQEASTALSAFAHPESSHLQGLAQAAKDEPESSAQNRRGQGWPRRSVQGSIHSGFARTTPARPPTVEAHPSHPMSDANLIPDSTIPFSPAPKDEIPSIHEMHLSPLSLINLKTGERKAPKGEGRQVHAVAGIGNPQRFFDTLKSRDFAIIPAVFSDHHAFQAQDLAFPDDLDIVMTEKDAVKCQPFADPRCWYLKVEATLPQSFFTALLSKLNDRAAKPEGHREHG